MLASQLLVLGRESLNASGLEACGFLIGYAAGPDTHVSRIESATNIDYQLDRFAISPREHTQLAAALTPGEEIVGIFHSHRKEARPSPADLKGMRDQRSIWLIVGNTDRNRMEELTYSAFRDAGQSIELLTLTIVPG